MTTAKDHRRVLAETGRRFARALLGLTAAAALQELTAAGLLSQQAASIVVVLALILILELEPSEVTG